MIGMDGFLWNEWTQTDHADPIGERFSAHLTCQRLCGLLISARTQVSLEKCQCYGEVQHDNLVILLQ
jgi:hypothetical protein